MRASLARHINIIRASFRDERDAASAAHVHNVQSTTGFGRKIDSVFYRFQFRFNRPRFEIIIDRGFFAAILSFVSRCVISCDSA